MVGQYRFLGFLLCCWGAWSWAEVVTEPLYSFPSEEQLVGHTSLVTSVAFSPDGKTLLSGSYDNAIKLWDIETGQEIRSFIGHSNRVNSVTFSPDQQTILSGSSDKTLKLWDTQTGIEIRTFIGHIWSVNSVAFAPDGQTVLSGSSDDTLRLWDVHTGQEIRSFSGHADWVNSIAFAPDGQTVLSGSSDDTLRLWDVHTGQEIRSFSGHAGSVNSIAFAPDGQTILSGSHDSTLKLWDIQTGQEIQYFSGHADWVNSTAFAPDGRTILSGSHDSTLKLWDVQTGQEIRSFLGHSHWVDSVAFAPDGKTILSGSADSSLKLWNVQTGVEISQLGYNHHIIQLALSIDGEYLASAGSNSELKLWSVQTSKEIHSFVGHTSRVTSVAFASDGQTILSGSRDTNLKLWDVQTGREIRSFLDHIDWIHSVAFAPNGQTVLSGSGDTTLKLWDVQTGQEIRSFWGHTGSVYSVAFAPDGQTVLSGSFDNTLKLWDAQTGQEIRTFIGHTGGVESVSFAPDGRTILSGSSDRTLKLWDVQTGQQILTFLGHTMPITSVSYAPNGKTLLSGSYDNAIKLWDIETGQEIRSFEGHKSSLTSIAFSPTGRRIYSGGYDRTIKVWDSGLVTTPMLTLPTTLALPLNTTQTITPTAGTAISWESADPSIASVDNNGTVTANATGTVAIKAYDADGLYQILPVTVTTTPTNTDTSSDSPGRAVIIASGWPSKDNSVFDITEAVTLRMYRLLKRRGFSDDNIIYFNPRAEQDLDGDGFPDPIVDYQFFDDPLGELNTAFADIKASLQAGQQFVFYLHGHARPNTIEKLNRDTDLTAEQLAQLLNDLPDHTQQIILIDTCYAGSFLDNLQGRAKRIVMTSSDAHNVSWNQKQDTFTDFWVEEARSLNEQGILNQAFQRAETLITRNPTAYGNQKPQLDDDGDGIYTTRDGRLAAQTWLGRPGNPGSLPPDITAVHDIINITATDTAQLWVKTRPAEPAQLRSVWARLTPITTDVLLYTGINSLFTRTEIELSYDSSQQRYQADFSEFTQAGIWQVAYRAQGLDGTWSSRALGEIQVSAATIPPKFDPTLPVQIRPLFNLSRYRVGQPLIFNLNLKGQVDQYQPYDLYAGVLFPDGTLYSFSYPDVIHAGVLKPYREAVNLRGERRFNILDFPLPELPQGRYEGCGLITQVDSDPWQQESWAHMHCEPFEIE